MYSGISQTFDTRLLISFYDINKISIQIVVCLPFESK